MNDSTYRAHTVTVPNATLPVSLVEARRHLRTEGLTFDDSYVEAIIAAAAANVEMQYSLGLLNQTVKQYHSSFPAMGQPLFLAVAPLISITSIKYMDASGAEVDWLAAEYTNGGYNGCPFIVPKIGFAWPSTAPNQPNAVTVTYQAGFGSATTDIPKEIKQAILLMVGDMYNNREDRLDSIPRASKALLRPYFRFSA